MAVIIGPSRPRVSPGTSAAHNGAALAPAANSKANRAAAAKLALTGRRGLQRRHPGRNVRPPAGPCLPRGENFPSSPPQGLRQAAPRIAFSAASCPALCSEPPNPWLRSALSSSISATRAAPSLADEIG
ncbi:unnamed protein product [Urochloa humidicola]